MVRNRVKPPTCSRVAVGLLVLVASTAVVSAVPREAEALSTVATVDVGEAPVAVAVNDVTNKVYTANAQAGTVSEIDGSTLSRRDIRVGIWPRAVAVSRSPNVVLVANYVSNSVTVITPSATPVTAEISVAEGPVDISVNQTTKKAYVSSMVTGALTVIDIPSLTIEAVIPFPFQGPWDVEVNDLTNKIFVTLQQTGAFAVVDGATNSVDTVLGTFGQWPYKIAVNKATNTAFVVNQNLAAIPGLPDNIAIWDLNTMGQAFIELDPSGTKTLLLRDVAVDEVANKAYVVGYFMVELLEIDGATWTISEEIPFGLTHANVMIHEGARRLYSTNVAAGTLDQMHLTSKATSHTFVGNQPWNAALDESRNLIYVTNRTSANLSVVSGDCGPGMPGSVQTSFLTEGSTINFEEWVVLANPDASQTSTCISYFTESGYVGGKWLTIGPNRRVSVRLNDLVSSHQVSTRIEAGPKPVFAERAMYSTMPGLYGAHLGKAATSTASNWILPEGVAAGGSETWVLVSNPNAALTANVMVTFLTASGPVPLPTFSLPPLTRRSIRVNDYVSTYEVSTKVESTGAGVVAERATYLAHSGYVGSTEAPGIPSTSATWYIGEGATAGGFDTWVLLANPDGSAAATANLTFLTSAGPMPGPTVVIPPLSRRSVRVNDYVTDFDVATRVTADKPIAAERALYSNHPVHGKGSAAGEGITSPKTSWLMVEGATAGGFETWTLIANPDTASPQTVKVTYLTAGGAIAPAPLQSLVIPPGRRISIRANDYVPDNFTVSARVEVTSGSGVVAEHTIFSPSYLAQDVTSGPGF